MDDSRINIRLLMWHLKLMDDWSVTWIYNDAHKKLKYGWFSVYNFNPFKKI